MTELHFKHVPQFDVWLNVTGCSVQQQTGRFCGETPGGKMELIHRWQAVRPNLWEEPRAGNKTRDAERPQRQLHCFKAERTNLVHEIKMLYSDESVSHMLPWERLLSFLAQQKLRDLKNKALFPAKKCSSCRYWSVLEKCRNLKVQLLEFTLNLWDHPATDAQVNLKHEINKK